MLIFFLREINTLAAPSYSHAAKLAATEDIKLSSSKVPLEHVSSIYSGCSMNVAAQDERIKGSMVLLCPNN